MTRSEKLDRAAVVRNKSFALSNRIDEITREIRQLDGDNLLPEVEARIVTLEEEWGRVNAELKVTYKEFEQLSNELF